MTQVELLEALKKFLDDALKDINLFAPKNLSVAPIGSLKVTQPLAEELPQIEVDTPVKVNVFEGFVPSAKKDDSYFPYVSIFILEGKTNGQCSQVKIQFDLGVYSKNEEEGIKPLLNLLQRILYGLNTIENHILDSKFTLDTNINWQVSSDDTRPYYNASIFTTWQFLNSQPEFRETSWDW